MTRSDISVGDRVRVLTGAREGCEGRVVIRKQVVAFGRLGTIFEVDFEDHPRLAQGYFTTQYQPHHLKRINP